MEGFSGSNPILVRVSWIEGETEIPLSSPVSLPEGLLAEVVDGAGIKTRWFVPWTHVIYIRQQLSAKESGAVPAQAPVIPAAVVSTGDPTPARSKTN